MHKTYVFLLCIFVTTLYVQCDSKEKNKQVNTQNILQEDESKALHLLHDIEPLTANGDVNAIIEISAGTLDKWELDKTTGEISWELIDNQPRVVNYIGYPGNYGMIPRTLLSKESGGDGDPLDILVLGAPEERGQVIKCKLIGVLYLQDRGEQDDKLIAVSIDSPMYGVQSIAELNNQYKGVTDIIQLWFSNYKGPGKMESNGFGNKEVALNILTQAINEYQLNKTKGAK
ncbi:inorganic diphosphatase [Patiriisocius sp. Uisw_047]|jgi:inorganic pyrophosphatase|uniref:inorganic diphosphatase n=1 Tax=Patiriisocius sp. Uisw_047 TaxID=3230969 RepID=UPI0039EC4BC7